jgi:hypothetical protein
MTTRYGLPPYTGPDSPQTPVPLPEYKATRIAICPEHHADLEQEADGFWCTQNGGHFLPFSHVIHPGDIDD